MKILFVEDDDAIALGLIYSLEKEGYQITHYKTQKEAINALSEQSFDLLLLDVGLPDGNGYEICRYAKSKQEVPVIFLTAMDDEVNIVMGLDIGGDDYITKPFSLKLVLMRIEAVLRRIKEKSEKQKILSAQGIELNKDSHEVYKNGAPVNLTQLEFELLLTFLNHKNQVLTRDNLIQQVWGYDFAGDEKTVNIHIMNLRRKLDTGCIHTIRGVRYKFESKN